MKKCWDSDPTNRPDAIEIYELISFFCRLCMGEYIGNISALEIKGYEIKDQFKKAEEYRKSHAPHFEKNKQTATYPGSHGSQLLNPLIKDLHSCDSAKIDFRNSCSSCSSVDY